MLGSNDIKHVYYMPVLNNVDSLTMVGNTNSKLLQATVCDLMK